MKSLGQEQRSTVTDLLQSGVSERAHNIVRTDPELLAQNSHLREQVAQLRLRILDLERKADMDPLLSVYNRRAFMAEIHRAQSVMDRFDLHSSIIFFDLDGFKSVNDTYGHGVGDEVLKAVAKTLLSGVRNCDMVARLGGDEFGVLLFKSDPHVAAAKASTLSCRIDTIRIPVTDGNVQISASWGVADCSQDASAQTIMDRADREMYRRKRRTQK